MKQSRVYHNVEPSVASHFPSLSKGHDIDPDVHMFTEDIHLTIMPIGGQTEKQKQFTVDFQGEEPECKKAEEIIGKLGNFDQYDKTAIVCDAVDNIAKHLAREGNAVYEIIKDAERTYIHGFTSYNLYKIIFWYLQIIPPSDWGYWKKKFNWLSEKRIWKVRIPQKLGGARGHKRVLKRLRRYSHLGPNFYRQDLEQGNTTKYFDFIKFIRNNEIYFNRVTKKWGWNRRDWSQKKCTEYYTFYKMIGFKYAQAILREHIIEEINQLLKSLSIKCKIIITGLPTAKEILQTKNDIQKGNISFTQVSDKVAI